MIPPGMNNSLKLLEVKLSPLKNLWWVPILVATSNICKNSLAYRHYLSGYCEKYAQSTVFSFSKKDSVTRLGLSQNLKNGV